MPRAALPGADRVVVMTPRPGRVVNVLEIELPRPRDVGMEFSAQFKTYAEAIRSGITSSRHTG